MTRSIACLLFCTALCLVTAGAAYGQAAAEAGLGAAGAATAAGPMKGIGNAMNGLSGALDKALKPVQTVPEYKPAAATRVRPVTSAKSKATNKMDPAAGPVAAAPALAPPPPAKIWEDPAGVETGLAYTELLSRFGPPTMIVTSSTERSFIYRGKQGMFQVQVRDEKVASIDKPQS